MRADLQPDLPLAREGFVPVHRAELYYREVGYGRPIVILHGGPDFGHTYLLPDLDRLAGAFRLIYYDQRGRGKSSRGVEPEDVDMTSEINDLDRLRAFFRLDSVALLGHSWGGLLAMEYAVRRPDRVSHLVLMSSDAASHDDSLLFREEYLKKIAPYRDEMQALSSRPESAAGDPDTVAAYYRIHFTPTLRAPDLLDRLMARLRASFTSEGILKGWAIEDRLRNETLRSSDYDLLPALARLRIPTLVIHAEDDFVPVECAAHVAGTIPGARLVLLPDCGHFAYMESPERVHEAITDLFAEA